MEALNVTALVRAFQGAVEGAWPFVVASLGHPRPGYNHLLDDWLQGMWETLVEAPIAITKEGPIALEIYGNGADCNGRSSRVCYPERLPTHTICVASPAGSVADFLSDAAVDLAARRYPLDRFVARVGEWYAEQPPFDHVLILDNRKQRMLSLEKLEFTLVAHDEC